MRVDDCGLALLQTLQPGISADDPLRHGRGRIWRIRTYGTLASARSLRFDVGCPDYLAPFLGFVGDELSEIGGRAAKHGAAQIGEPRHDLGVRESRVDLFVERVNDFSGRSPG